MNPRAICPYPYGSAVSIAIFWERRKIASPSAAPTATAATITAYLKLSADFKFSLGFLICAALILGTFQSLFNLGLRVPSSRSSIWDLHSAVLVQQTP